MDGILHYGFYFKKINEILEKRANQNMQELNLTCAQSHILFQLGEMDGFRCSLKELERRLHVAQSTVAGTVLRMEKKGFVESMNAPEDRRIKMVQMTELGKEQLEASKRGFAETEQLIMSGMTEAERQTFARLLMTVYGTLVEHTDS